MPDRVRVLIVDDSRLFRSMLEEALASEPDIEVVGSVYSGQKALDFIRATPPDVVTLDVEMPGMDGNQALLEIQQLGAEDPRCAAIGVLMVSAHTRQGTEISMRALAAGAFDVVAKPSEASPAEAIARLRQEIAPRILAFARRAPRPAAPPPAVPQRRPALPARGTRCIVIGASTGGPRALCTLLPPLCAATRLPILLTQHMPVGFTASLASTLAREAKARVIEAGDGMTGTAEAPRLGLNDQPPENGCRPSVDVLFRAAAATFGGSLLAVILTGMGRDGAAGAGAIRRAGGYVIVQDEATSVVWGMPGSAVEAGVADEVVPLPAMAAAIRAAIRTI